MNPISLQDVQYFLTSPQAILAVGKDQGGRKYLYTITKGIWTWFATFILKWDCYQLKTVAELLGEQEGQIKRYLKKSSNF